MLRETALPLSRLLAEAVSAGIGLWAIRNILKKAHKLDKLGLLVRWGTIATSAIATLVGWKYHLAYLNIAGVFVCFFFFLFPDISYYLVQGYYKSKKG